MCFAEDLQDAQHHCSPPCVFNEAGLGKRQSRGPVAAPGPFPTVSSVSAASTTGQGALSIFCRRLRRQFLVDSGADVSVFPAAPSRKKLKPQSSLSAANGSSIRTYGRRDISLDFPGLSVVHSFFLADVTQPILGSDFFRQNNILIDVAQCRLVRQVRPGALAGAVTIKARAAAFAQGLCGLRCNLSSVDAVFLSLIHI